MVGAPFERCHVLQGISLALLVGRAGQPNQDGDRAFDVGRLASGNGAGGVDLRSQLRDASGSIAGPAVPRIPAVDVRHRELQHPLTNGPDHQRWSARTRARQQFAVSSRIELSLKVDAAIAQERANDGEGFGKSRHASIEGKAERAIFRLIPSRTEPEDETSAADLIDGRGQLAQHRGIMKAGAGDHRPDRDPAGRGGDARQRRPSLPGASGAAGRVTVEEMVAHPYRIETKLLAQASHGDNLRPADFALHLWQLEADLERADYACLTW